MGSFKLGKSRQYYFVGLGIGCYRSLGVLSKNINYVFFFDSGYIVISRFEFYSVDFRVDMYFIFSGLVLK